MCSIAMFDAYPAIVASQAAVQVLGGNHTGGPQVPVSGGLNDHAGAASRGAQSTPAGNLLASESGLLGHNSCHLDESCTVTAPPGWLTSYKRARALRGAGGSPMLCRAAEISDLSKFRS
jgi:hypothetical protein